MWIVETKQSPLGDLYLYDYAAGTKEEVERKVMAVAAKEGFKGSVQERLQHLQWNILEVWLTRTDTPINANAKAFRDQLKSRNERDRFMLDTVKMGRQYMP